MKSTKPTKPTRVYLEKRLNEIKLARLKAWTKQYPAPEEDLTLEEMHDDITSGRAKLRPLQALKKRNERVRYINVVDAFDFPSLPQKKQAAKDWSRKYNALDDALTHEIGEILDRIIVGGADPMTELAALKKGN